MSADFTDVRSGPRDSERGGAVPVTLSDVLLRSRPVQRRAVAERPAIRRILTGHLIGVKGALQGAWARYVDVFMAGLLTCLCRPWAVAVFGDRGCVSPLLQKEKKSPPSGSRRLLRPEIQGVRAVCLFGGEPRFS